MQALSTLSSINAAANSPLYQEAYAQYILKRHAGFLYSQIDTYMHSTDILSQVSHQTRRFHSIPVCQGRACRPCQPFHLPINATLYLMLACVLHQAAASSICGNLESVHPY